MKKFVFLASLMLLAGNILAMGSSGWTSLTNKIPQASTSNTVPVVQTPTAPASDLVAAGSFVRPDLYADADGHLYVATEGPGMGSIHRFVTDAKGRWSGGLIITASKATAERTYVVRILRDIISFRYGNKEDGKLHGPGTYRNGKEAFEGFSTGAARLAMSPVGPILMSKNGIYKNLTTGKVANYNAGETGEKFDFAISGSTWATCHNGCAKDPSSVSINGKRQVWADYATYGKWYGVDMCYPSVLIAKDGSVWCASVLGGRLRVQQITAKGLRWPTTALGDLGPAAMEERCPPRLIATSKGVTAVWRSGKDIVMIDIEKGLKGQKPVRIASGAFPAVVVDPGWRVHMVYVDGGLKYREIK